MFGGTSDEMEDNPLPYLATLLLETTVKLPKIPWYEKFSNGIKIS
jgi:hypothetical protein